MSHLFDSRRTVLTILMILVTVPMLAQAQDEVGIYWDAGFTSNIGQTATIPGVATGYVVLHNPSGTGGVLGWEACIEIVGPASFTGWDFQGQAINAGTDPCFAVGYSAPLPTGNDIILASFNIVALETGPITIDMRPAWSASLPGQLSYIPGDDPENLVAMYTVTGTEAVAGLNGGNPGVIIERDAIDFGSVVLGESRSEFLNVANASNVPLELDLSITDQCTYFTLPGGTGPLTIPANSAVDVEIVFTPTQPFQTTCALYLGPGMNPVALTGSGHEAVTSWYFTGFPNLGGIDVGQQTDRWFSVVNNGDITYEVDISLPAGCDEFSITSGAGTHIMPPGSEVDFRVVFAPVSAGEKTCSVSFGDSPVSGLVISGWGLAVPESWEAPTNYDFLTRDVGVPAYASLTITNTGGTIIPLHASFLDPCSAFELIAGGNVDVSLHPGLSHVLTVRFLSNGPGQFICAVDLGGIIPPIQLLGEAIPAAGSVTVAPSWLGFPATLIGQSNEMDLIITNTVAYEVPLDVQIVNQNSDFLVINGGGIHTVAIGASHTVRVRFSPQTAGFQEEFLALGDAHTSVPLSGDGIDGTPDCLIVPASLNFGSLPLGAVTDLDFTITNAGNTALMIEPVSTESDFTVTDLPGLLEPGQQRVLTVTYHASAGGPITGNILLGDAACSAVTLSANGTIDPDWLIVTPPSVDIAPTPNGTSVDREIVVSNNGPQPINLAVEILTPTNGFDLTEGAGVSTLYPGEDRTIGVRFMSYTAGAFDAILALGTGLPVVPLHAISEEIAPDCELSATTINFGGTPIGSTRYRYVSVTNNTTAEMVLGPLSLTPAFSVNDTPISIAPGEATTIQIRFNPTGNTSYIGTVSLSNDLCMDIQCFGQGAFQPVPDTNVLGIYWDPDYMPWETWVTGDNSVLTGYLMLSNPSMGSAVSAWECEVGVDGPAMILGWQLEGQAINLGAGNEFVVGLADPLPFVNNHALLASFEVLYTDMWENAMFSVTPVYRASLPDQMAWVSDIDPDILLPMQPRGGFDEVAFIGPGSPLGLAAPTPVAQLSGSQIDLSWPAPADANDGCHVYRRLDGESAVRLTNDPIITTATDIVFTDVTSGLPAGSKLFYSYAIIHAGTELARSAEVEITLPDLPLTTTRLLPNVPNPFNPMTEIRFELGSTQSVSVRIYDVTGRLVRDLASGSLTAGPHTRVWQGRDNRGRQVPSGAYYVRLVTNNKVDSRKVMLLK